MTEQEYRELVAIIRVTHPSERLSIVPLGGGLRAIRMDDKGTIVWNRQDWEEAHLKIRPPVVERSEEVEA
jgi:hypothetical protein